MANVYIEPRPKGRPEGDPMHDYVVEDHADHVLATFKTQHEGNRVGEEERPYRSRRACPASERQEEGRPLARRLKVSGILLSFQPRRSPARMMRSARHFRLSQSDGSRIVRVGGLGEFV